MGSGVSRLSATFCQFSFVYDGVGGSPGPYCSMQPLPRLKYVVKSRLKYVVSLYSELLVSFATYVVTSSVRGHLNQKTKLWFHRTMMNVLFDATCSDERVGYEVRTARFLVDWILPGPRPVLSAPGAPAITHL